MNENQEQNLNNNIFNDYKKYIKRPGAKTSSTKVGEICRIIAIILFISGIILAFTGTVMPGVYLILVSLIPMIIWMLFGGIIIPKSEEINVFVKKNNQIYYISNESLMSNNEFAPLIMAQSLGSSNGITAILGLFAISSRKKNVDRLYEMLSQKSFDDPYFINYANHIQSVEIIKETPSYLKINARFENQGRKSITIYNIYEDYNELIKEIKNIGGKQWS